MKKQMLKDSLILFGITLIAGLLLGGVYAITKGPIVKTQNDKKQEAYQAVFADAAEFQDMAQASVEDAAEVLTAAGYDKDRIDEVKQAVDASGTPLGYVMTVTSTEAYSGELQLTVGICMDGTVNQISFLSLSETMGLGMEAKQPAFYEQFSNKRADAFFCTKSGAVTDSEIDALSGATITSNAVTNAVNASIAYAKHLGLTTVEAGGEGNE